MLSKQNERFLWIASVALCISLTLGERYQLTYDAIIFDPNKAVHLDSRGSSSGGADGLDVMMMKSIGKDFVTHWNNYKYHYKHDDEADSDAISNDSDDFTNDEIEVNCFLKAAGSREKKSTCIAHFEEEELGLDFSIQSVMYKIEDVHQVAEYSLHLTEAQRNFTGYALQGVSFDVIVDAKSDAAPGLFARDSLIHALHALRALPYTVEDLSPVWSIRERPKPLQVSQLRTDLATMRNPQGVPTSDAASMEMMILSKSNANKRYQHTTYSHLVKESISIWTIEEAGKIPVQCLFLNGQLRATTSEAGTAHAEAFVHPALIAHPDPRRIAIISDMPLPLLKEILKYKSIEEVTLVGADTNAIDLTRRHMKELDYCYMDGRYRKCMDDERITVVNGNDATSWLNAKVEIAKMDDGGAQYDVILVDASTHIEMLTTSQHDDEEERFTHKLQYLMGSNSLVVFNAGSTPRSDVDFGVASYRDSLLEMLLHEDSDFGTATLYDEPQSSPLESTFVILFSFIDDYSSYFSESYFRYVRSSPTAIDLDIIDRFHKQEFLPTRNYDGATHGNYLIPSRAWENWYCESMLGRNEISCKEFMKDFYNPVLHQAKTEVRRDPVKGRGLYALNDIPKGAFINADDSHMNLHIHRYQMNALEQFVEDYPDADMYKQLLHFFHAYGFENEPNGLSGWTVSVANMNTFMNHACSKEARNSESTSDVYIETLLAEDGNSTGRDEYFLFSPILYRQKNLSMITVAARDIKAGEELQMDYSDFRSTMTPAYATLLKSFCEKGEGLVYVKGTDEL